MAEGEFKDCFSACAADYAAHRPTYPPELGVYLASQAPGRDLALDCGCGNGQLSTMLADHFARVVATDASAMQIAAAAPHPRIEYRAARAEESVLPPGSADLIVAAQAAHWFDLAAFYAEARRAAKPGALIALVTYGVFDVEGEAEPAVQDFYWKTIGPFWAPERRYVEDGYRSLPFPFPELAAPALVIERMWLRDQLLAYIDTWSAVREAERSVGRGLFEDFAMELAKIWPDGERRMVRWPLSIRAGRIL
jgi:SAM-dependent methyltransferase